MNRYTSPPSPNKTVSQLTPIARLLRSSSALGFGLAWGMSQAATIQVTSNLDNQIDDDLCTLREAVVSINMGSNQGNGCSNSGAAYGTNDRITFSSGLTTSNTIALQSGRLQLNDVVIDASNINAGITIDAASQNNGTRGIFNISSGSSGLDGIHLTGVAVNHAINIDSATVTLANSRVFANSARAIEADSASITLNNCQLYDNTNGTLLARNSNLIIDNSIIRNNSISGNGGGLSIFGASELTMSNTSVTDNQGLNFGGGIDLGSSSSGSPSATITNSVISGNSAIIGGGLRGAGNSSITLNNSRVSDNTATRNGAGLAIGANSMITLNNSTVSGNTKTGGIEGGGGLRVEANSTITINRSNIRDNYSTLTGGGAQIIRSNVYINDSTIANNVSAGSGGGLSINSNEDVRVILSNSSVSSNSAGLSGTGASGGGISIFDSPSITLSNSTISGNSASFSGGGIQIVRSSLALINSTLSGNSAERRAGGLEVGNATATLMNTTVTDSTCAGCTDSNYAGGIHNIFGGSLTLVNSIVTNSSSFDVWANNLVLDGFSLVGSFNRVNPDNSQRETGTTTGQAEVGLLPLADNGGPTLTHALSEASLARNAGNLATCTEFDQRGRRRNSGADDNACDVGAFEDVALPDTSFFVIPLGNGRTAVVPL